MTAVVISLPFNTNFSQFYFPGLFIAGLIGMPILIFWLYGQLFYFDFLPKLDTIIENYEGKQLKHLKKCQQAQMSNFAAAVVYYTFAKTGRFNIPPINHQYGELLMNLFGKDPDSMQEALKLIICEKPSLTLHKQTEIGKSLEEARNFFEAIEFPQAVKVVDQLDLRFMTV